MPSASATPETPLDRLAERINDAVHQALGRRDQRP
jgi:hypothetical protein